MKLKLNYNVNINVNFYINNCVQFYIRYLCFTWAAHQVILSCF